MITILRQIKLKAAKVHSCIWCPEKIAKGEQHLHLISVFNRDFQDHRWHPECLAAWGRDYAENHEEDFPAHAFKRGSTEEA